MTLPVPPRRSTLVSGSAARWPGADTRRGGSAGGATLLVRENYEDVLGSPGASPTADQFNYVYNNGPLWNDPAASPDFGSWIRTWRWWRPTGGPFARAFNLFVEFHPGAVLEALGGPATLGYTGREGDAGMPAATGLTYYGDTVAALGYEGFNNIRVLMHEGLVPDGLDIFPGQRGFTECLVHEFGHVAMTLLAENHGEDWLESVVCDLFGRPVEDFNNPGLPWGQRPVEAAAETFKDFAYPNRLHDNRTALKLPRANREDFLELFFGYAETPAWEYQNGAARFPYSLDPVGGGDDWHYIATGSGLKLLFATDEFVAAHSEIEIPRFNRLPILWPIEGDNLEIRWNFNVEPYAPSWVGDDNTGVMHDRPWSDYDPQLEAKVQLGIIWYSVEPSFGGELVPTTVLDVSSVEVNPANNPAGSGTFTVPIPAGLPADAVFAELSIGLLEPPWQYPRPAPPDIASLPTGDLYFYYDGVDFIHPVWGPGVAGWADTGTMDYTRPILEYAGGVKLARWPILDLPWPYATTPPPTVKGSIHVGHPRAARVPVTERVIGRFG